MSDPRALVPVGAPETVTFYGKKILLCLPWYKAVTPATAFSVAQLKDRRRTSSIVDYGDAFIAHERNKMADAFLRTDCEYMLTIDDDTIVQFGNAKWFAANTGFNLPEPFASMNTLDRLMSHRKSLIGALYWGRWKGGKPIFCEGMTSDVLAEDLRKTCPRDEILETGWVGTGCMLIHRKVFEDIEARFPNLARKPAPEGKSGGNWFSSSEHTLLDSVQRVRDMLATGPMTGEKCFKAYEGLEAALTEARSISGLGVGEDVIFCRRARQAGHKCYVDLGCIVGHIGQHCYGLGK
jgi:hypothetical protein